MAFVDYYKILGVDKNIPQKDVRAAYRKRAKQFHPDLHPNDPKAKAKFQALNEAYEVISDPDKRAKYDQYGEQWKNADAFGGFGGAGGAGGSGSYGGAGGNPFEGFDFSQFGGGGGFSSFFENLFGGLMDSVPAISADLMVLPVLVAALMGQATELVLISVLAVVEAVAVRMAVPITAK